MKDASLYRQLAAGGNKAAARILDAEGATPGEEMGEEESEEQELEDLADLKARVSELVAKAAAHTESQDHARAADAHVGIARLYEESGRHKRAMDAYKNATISLYQHAKDSGSCYGMSLPQIQAIHAHQNAAK